MPGNDYNGVYTQVARLETMRILMGNASSWMEILLEELKFTKIVKIMLLVDNKSEINFDNHPMSHEISKIITIKYHFLRDQVRKDRLEIEYRKI